MPGLIPEDFIDDLRNRVDIVALIGEFVPLKKQGQNYVGLCPFHPEKTPSFVVSPHKQIFHCFGCGQGGNVYTFLMKREGLNFPEAVSHLAKYCGVALPPRDLSPEQAKQDSLRKKFYHINELAADFFQKKLTESVGQTAVTYLAQRGLKQEIKEKFLLGYAPQAWDELKCFLSKKGVAEQDLLTLGLVSQGQKGNFFDRFRNRLILPITNPGGKIIGFGGRVLDETLPKYLNSPETPLFHKGEQLYGLQQARGFIRNKDRVILMEGYLDVITAHQYGIREAVGTLGTALTEKQVRLLMRYTYNVILCFDADSAGQEAVERGLALLQKFGLKTAVMFMPPGQDPDDFLRQAGPAKFKQLLAEAYPLFEYNLLRLSEKYDGDTVAGKIKIIEELVPLLAQTKSPVQRQAYIQKLAEQFSFSEKAIYAEIRKFQQGRRGDEQKKVVLPEKEMTALEKAQRILLGLLLKKPAVMAELEKIGGLELFRNHLCREIYQTNYLLGQAGHNIKAEDLITHLETVEAGQLLTEILLTDELATVDERVYEDCLTTLKIDGLNQKIEKKQVLMIDYEKNGEVTKSLEVMVQVQKMIKERQKLVSTLAKGGDVLEEGK